MNNLRKFHNIHRGETGVVIGNGPSLKLDHLEALGRNYVTFGSNKIYRLPYTPTYYSIADKKMMRSCLPLPDNFRPKEIFLRAEACVDGNNPIYPIVFNGFGLDIENFLVLGGTISYVLLQIAFYMGFRNILLIGIDHSYPGIDTGQCGSFVAGDSDIDHFVCADGKPYFDTGKIFNRPELEGTRRSYAIADELFRKDGRTITNLTPGTKLDVFQKDDIARWITQRKGA